MRAVLRLLLYELRRRRREKLFISEALRLNDHLLEDIGLRRDQLQPDGIHELDSPPRPRAARQPTVRRGVIAPALQGCG